MIGIFLNYGTQKPPKIFSFKFLLQKGAGFFKINTTPSSWSSGPGTRTSGDQKSDLMAASRLHLYSCTKRHYLQASFVILLLRLPYGS